MNQKEIRNLKPVRREILEEDIFGNIVSADMRKNTTAAMRARQKLGKLHEVERIAAGKNERTMPNLTNRKRVG